MGKYLWLHWGKTIPVTEPVIITILEKSGTRAACLWDEKDSRELDMEEVLLDERITGNGIILEAELLCEVGGENMRLPVKREYELALRIAEKEKLVQLPFEALGARTFAEGNQTAEVQRDDWDNFCVDAYIVGRYSEFLKKRGLFEAVLEAVLEEGLAVESGETVELFLQDMIGHKDQYLYYYDATQPILICRGSSCCYNILNIFAEKLAEALIALGNRIEFYDAEKEDVQGLARLIGKRYKAMIGFQAWILSAQLKNSKSSLLDRIGGPKYNFIFDHPIWMQEQLRCVPKRYYALTHDRNYVAFIKKYDAAVKDVYLLPPGGRESVWTDDDKRMYDVVFLGTYGNYRGKLDVIADCARERRFLAARFMLYMKQSPSITAEEALKRALVYYGMELEPEEFLEMFGEMKEVIQCIMYYYREKVVEEILKAGIELHVFGDSWKESPFAQNPFLKQHEAVHGEVALQMLGNAKISLNIMAWHKDGFTERIADSMLSGAVVVSDYSTQLEEFYAEETVLFDLQKLEELPPVLKTLLSDEDRRRSLSEAARRKAHASATWEVRAKEMLQIIEEESRMK